MTDVLYTLLKQQGIGNECAEDTTNVMFLVDELHHAKADLERKGYLVRSDGNGNFDLHDMNTHQVVKWHYDFDTGVFTLIKPFERQFKTPMGTLTLHNHPLFNHDSTATTDQADCCPLIYSKT